MRAFKRVKVKAAAVMILLDESNDIRQVTVI